MRVWAKGVMDLRWLFLAAVYLFDWGRLQWFLRVELMVLWRIEKLFFFFLALLEFLGEVLVRYSHDWTLFFFLFCNLYFFENFRLFLFNIIILWTNFTNDFRGNIKILISLLTKFIENHFSFFSIVLSKRMIRKFFDVFIILQINLILRFNIAPPVAIESQLFVKLVIIMGGIHKKHLMLTKICLVVKLWQVTLQLQVLVMGTVKPLRFLDMWVIWHETEVELFGVCRKVRVTVCLILWHIFNNNIIIL